MLSSANRLIACSCLCIVLSCSGVLYGQQAEPNTPPVLLQMIRDSSVQDELKLSGSQRERVAETLKSIDGRWFRSRNLPAEEQRTEIATATTELQSSLKDLLDASQLRRLTQLERQALGTRMFTRADVAEALQISNSKQNELEAAFLETDRLAAEYQKQMQRGDLKTEDGQRKIAQLKQDEQQFLLKTLSTEQRAKIGELTGKPFDFSEVKRSLPLAPELTEQGVTWIQGGPLQLADLKGKVVALHYYAFQCINCKRNLPHYNAWHRDYADQGLVVIGIQRPETSAERSRERVAAAAKEAGILYPVLLDSDSANWDTWSNTMWPTVYLIDKQGFLRRWWQGEMNWQGTQGEQDMRQTIEQLLAEDAR